VGWFNGNTVLGELTASTLKMEAANPSETLLDVPKIHSDIGVDEIFRSSRPALGAHPACYTMGTGSFPGVKSDRGVTLTPHPLLVLWSKKE